MVAKKKEAEKKVAKAKGEKEEKKVAEKKTATSAKKETTAKKVSAKKVQVAEKVAVKKLKDSVKKVKEEKEKADSGSEKQAKVQEKKEVVAEKKKVSSVEVKKIFGANKNKISSVSVAGKSVGKIGEVKNGIARATGHRKRAIAKVACQEKGKDPVKISVNKLDYKSYFTTSVNQQVAFAPFALLGIKTGYVVSAEVFGGGKSGQADALKLGISRCLSLLSEEFNAILRKNSYLTRDARKVEPKKAGLRKARKKEQFSKR